MQPLPLTETSFFILLSLAAEPRHGYAIIKEVESMSRGRVVLATGTLYTALRRMLEDGWIERFDDGFSDGNGRERKFYRLTEEGRRIFSMEAERLRSLVRLTTAQITTD